MEASLCKKEPRRRDAWLLASALRNPAKAQILRCGIKLGSAAFNSPVICGTVKNFELPFLETLLALNALTSCKGLSV